MTSIPHPLGEDDVYIYYGDENHLEKSEHADQDTKSSSSPSSLLLGAKISRYRQAHKNNHNNNKVPKDVVKVLIHPLVKVIPNGTFSKCERLQQVQFGFFSSHNDDNSNMVSDENKDMTTCQLEIIGESAFSQCVSLKHIALPPSLKWIRKSAFEGCLTLLSVELCHGLERMDDRAFADCYGLKNVAIPKTVETIPSGTTVVTMRKYNSTLDQDAAADDDENEDDSSSSLEDPIIRSLRKRFHQLPIHHLCYYFHQLHPNYDSMDEKVIAQLVEDASKNAADGSLSTDAFGMTPLHILACSARPNPTLLQVLLDRIYNHDDDDASYSVLSKDSWGNYPIHYAVRCNAPLEIVKLLIDCQLVHHNHNSDHDVNVEQPPHLRHRRKEPPYWKGLLDLACNLASLPMTKFLIESSRKEQIDALQCPAWKEDVRNMIDGYQDHDEANKRDDGKGAMMNAMEKRQPTSLTSPRSRLQLIKALDKRLEWYKFQEPLSLLELAVWKAKLLLQRNDDSSSIMIGNSGGAEDRETSRIHCGAELVTMNVLNFLGNFEDQRRMAQWKKKKKRSIPLLPTPNPWATVPALRHL